MKKEQIDHIVSEMSEKFELINAIKHQAWMENNRITTQDAIELLKVLYLEGIYECCVTDGVEVHNM